MKEPIEGGDHLLELEAVGLLVAGALEPRERAEVSFHLRDCGRCRDELVEVAALPGLLRRLQPDAEPAPLSEGGPSWAALAGPPPAVRARLLAAGHTEVRRRQSRRRLLSAAAVVLPLALAAAVLLPSATGPAVPIAPTLVAMQRADPAVDVEGALASSQKPWGTALTVRMRWGKTGTATLVAIGRDGTEQTAAHWDATAGEQVLCEGSTSLSGVELDRYEVRNAAGEQLLVLPA